MNYLEIESVVGREILDSRGNGLINIAKPLKVDEEFFWDTLDKLYAEAYNETGNMKELVTMLVPTYTIDKGENAASA